MRLQKHSLERWMKWELRGNPSCHWTTALSNQWFYVSLCLLFVTQLVLSWLLPLTDDELYYWAWAQNLRLSYFDHPPMVAYLTFISTSLFGNNPIGIRFFACFFCFIVFSLVGKLSQDKEVLLLALFTPLIVFGGFLMTPDVPFILFWTLYIFWLVRINATFMNWNEDPIMRVYRSMPVWNTSWIWGGAILGLGCLSKYSMFLAIPCGFFTLLRHYRMSAWFKGYFIHLIVAFLFFLPVFYFNYTHHFEPIKWQFQHAVGSNSPKRFFEFWGTQTLLISGLPLLLLPWILARKNSFRNNSSLHVCFYFYFLPLTFFIFKSSRSYLEANWPLMSYVTFWPLAQKMISSLSIRWISRGLLIVSFLPAFACTAALLMHASNPISFIPPAKDRLRKSASMYEMTKTIAKEIKQNEITSPLYLPTYQFTAYFRFFKVKSEQLFPPGRPSSFTLEETSPCNNSEIFYLQEGVGLPDSLSCFKDSDNIKSYPLEVRGQITNTYQLYRLTK